MLYLVVSHSAEARPIIDSYRLKRVYTLPYTMFENDDVRLVISGMGIENAMMATSALLGHLPPKKSDILVNVGVCAAPQSLAVGEAFLAHKISYKGHSCFPDILFEHPLDESDIISVDAPAHDPLTAPTDMECYGVYKAASRFLSSHQMLFFKIVSDHFEPQNVTKELAAELVSGNIEKLRNVIDSAKFVAQKEDIFAEDENTLIKEIALHLTKAQSDAFYDACCYYRLHHKRPLHVSGVQAPDERLSKQQRSEYFERLIKTLTL